MKKILSLCMAAALILSVTACGAKGDSQTTAAAGGEGTTAAAAGDTTAAAGGEGTAAAGAETAAFAGEGSFKIGGIGPLTGAAAVYGMAVRNAAEIAVDEINAKGGINGYKVELKFQDDEHDAEKAVTAYNALKDWGMQMLVGTVTSTPCQAVAAETYTDNMFQLTPSGSAVKCVEKDNAFRVCFSDPDQGAASARYIGEKKLATKVAVIYKSDDIYSNGIYESFAKEAKNQKLEVTAEAFTDATKTDFSVQLQKAQSAGAELVFLPLYYGEASVILTQADGMGYKPVFFGCDGLDGILGGVENFDTKLAEGLMLLTPFAADAKDDATKAFVASYQDAYGEIPNQFAADGYDAVYAIKVAAEKAGLTPDMDASAICDALKVAMTQITLDGMTGTGMTWNASGEPDKAPKAVKIVNGAYTAMD